MKGIAHFSIGVALATFIPGAIERAASGHAFDLLVAGAFGLLPDTLDFKFARFFSREDFVVDPHPKKINPKEIAETVAKAVKVAHQERRKVNVRFHTIQLAQDRWRSYEIDFDTDENEVIVRVGPVVTTSKMPLSGTEFPPNRAEARVKLDVPIIYTHDGPSHVDILSGPTMGFEPTDDGRVEAVFIPWHRQFSHSFTLGLFIGLAFWALFGWYWALMTAIPFWAHVFFDCFGYMGGNLFWPITKKRTGGLRLFHASSPLANFFGVWTSAAVIVFNMNRFAPNPVFAMSAPRFFALWVGIPAAITGIYISLTKRKLPKISPEEEQIREFAEEIADGEEMGMKER